MLACVDVDYRSDHAIAACVVFGQWQDAAAIKEYTVRIAAVAPYTPGEFYRRELPCILEVLRKVLVPLDAVIIDGYVWLGPGRPGLGTHLYDALGGKVPIVGVAKTHFATAPAHEVFRPGSQRPLYVTAAGMDENLAAAHVSSMHGNHRIPTLLKLVDGLCRTHLK